MPPFEIWPSHRGPLDQEECIEVVLRVFQSPLEGQMVVEMDLAGLSLLLALLGLVRHGELGSGGCRP